MANKFNGRWQVFGPAGTDYTSFFQPAGTVSGGGTTLTVTNGDGTSIIYAGTGLSEAGGVLSGTVTSVTVKALGGATLATLTGTLANTFIFDTGGLSLFGGTALYNQLLSGDNLIVGSANGTPGAHEILAGGAGKDIYQPGNGNTTISDGGGTTTLDLSAFAGPATVDLLNQTFTVAGATGKMSGVGSIIGTALGDTITEQTDAVFDLKSGAGNDVIDATGSTLYGARTTLDAGTGDDTVTINQFGYGYLDGGAGNDTLRAGGDTRYYNFTNFETLENTNFLRLRTEQLSSVSHITNSNPFNGNQVGVELWTAGTVDFGRLMAPGVTAVSVGEVAGTHVNGTAGNDSFQDVSNGLIDGFSTPSTFSGRGGDDTLFDNSGNVTAEFSGKMADYTIVHAPGLGSDYLVTDNRPGSPDGTDTLVGVNPLKPMLQFADYFASISEQQAYKADNTQLPGQIYNGFLDLFGPNNFDYEAMFPALGKAVSAILSGTSDTYTINYQGGTQIVFKGSGLTTSNQFAPSGGLVNDITVYDTSTPGAPVKLAHFYSDAASNHLMKVPFTSDILTGGTRVYQLLMSGNNRILGSPNDDLIASDPGNNELDAAGGFNTLRLGPNVDSFNIQYTADGQISSVSFVDEEANYLNFNIFDPNHPIIVNLNNVTQYHNDHFFMPPPPPPNPPAQPKPSAKAGGDPHITSLDGVGYSFHALGEFVLSKSTVANDPFEIQMRTIPYVGLATVIQQTATAVGTDRVTFDASRADVVNVNGLNVDFSSGPVHLNGGTLTKLAAGEWLIAYDTGETLDVIVVQTAINFLSVGLDPGTHRGAGTLSGIWGNFDGDRNNDYQLADGTILPRPISKDVLYHAFADAWRVDQAHSLLDYGAGETTGTFTSTATPTTISLTDLPADVLAKADALVAGAGIADPGLREFAIYDYVVTGDTALITSIADLGQSGGGTLDFERPNSGPPATMLGVIATEASVVEAAGNAATPVTFEVYRTGPIIGDVTVNWTVAAPALGYFVAADFPGGILPSGQVTIPSQSSSATFTVNIPGGAVTLASELLQVQISSPASIPLLAAVAQAEVVNNAPATGATAEAEFLKLAGGGTLTHVGNAWTLDLGTFNQNTTFGDIRVAVANMAPASGNDLSDTFSTAGDLAAIAGASSFLKLGGGGVKAGITRTSTPPTAAFIRRR